jgi:hypothetical protein
MARRTRLHRDGPPQDPELWHRPPATHKSKSRSSGAQARLLLSARRCPLSGWRISPVAFVLRKEDGLRTSTRISTRTAFVHARNHQIRHHFRCSCRALRERLLAHRFWSLLWSEFSVDRSFSRMAASSLQSLTLQQSDSCHSHVPVCVMTPCGQRGSRFCEPYLAETWNDGWILKFIELKLKQAKKCDYNGSEWLSLSTTSSYALAARVALLPTAPQLLVRLCEDVCTMPTADTGSS